MQIFKNQFYVIRVNSSSISSAVVIILVAAEYARWVTIMLENSVARSVLEVSNAPEVISPAPLVPAIFNRACPEASVSNQALPVHSLRVGKGCQRQNGNRTGFAVIEQSGYNTVFIDTDTGIAAELCTVLLNVVGGKVAGKVG